jgi:transposase InsO family protein
LHWPLSQPEKGGKGATCGLYPKVLFCDNGGEFTSQMMDLWAYHHGCTIDFSRPGRPTDNAFVESFNGILRAECLDGHWFSSLHDATTESKLGDWKTTRAVLTNKVLRSLATVKNSMQSRIVGLVGDVTIRFRQGLII